MKDTGITRRIDEMGRIVIPKELRKTLKIKEGDPIEFYTENDKVIVKKYSPIANLENNAQTVADAIQELSEDSCVIVDTDQVVYSAGSKVKDLKGKQISPALAKALTERKSLILSKTDGGEVFKIIDEQAFEIENLILIPVMMSGDVYGGVILFDDDKEKRYNCADVKFVKLGANFLAKQFE